MSNEKFLSGMWEKFRDPVYAFEAHRSTYNGHISTPHAHDYPQLFYCVNGSLRHTVDDAEYDCREGSVIIVPPGSTHSFYADKEITCTVIQINILLNFFNDFTDENQIRAITHLFLPAFSKELRFSPFTFIQFDGAEKEAVQEVFTMLATREWKNFVSNPLALQKNFCKVFSLPTFTLSQRTLRLAAAFISGKYIPLIRSVYYMNLNYNTQITTDDLTNISGICRTDYFRYIKRILGFTHGMYIRLLKVSHASLLCKFSTYSLAYIADICGFCNLAHMDVAVKSLSPDKKSPGALRRERSAYITKHPLMIRSRSYYENVTPHLHAFGLE